MDIQPANEIWWTGMSDPLSVDMILSRSFLWDYCMYTVYHIGMCIWYFYDDLAVFFHSTGGF